jgi:superfamily II DNA helicase RecQ
VTKLLVTYLSIVVPFHEYICPGFPRSGYLFPDGKGKHWKTDIQTKVMKRETKARIGYGVNTRTYRQLQVGFDREFVRSGFHSLNPASCNSDDEHEDGTEEHISDKQAGHSGRIARNDYGGKGTRLDTHTSQQYRCASDKWQKWLILKPRPNPLQFIPHSSPTEPTLADRDTLIRAALTKLYGEHPKWSSDEQKRSIYALLDGVSPLISILCTGAGKTASILIPALVEEGQSVVVTPYIPLAEDLEETCNKLKIDCVRWTPGTLRRAKIIIVVADTGTSGEFGTFLRDIFNEGRLSRIHFDEAHSLTGEKHFRPKFEAFRRLCLPVAIHFMTATFPPTHEQTFESELLLIRPPPIYIRGNTNRLNAQYEVREIADEEMNSAVAKLVDEESKNLAIDEKILIFCSSVTEVKEISEFLKCASYYSGSPTKDKALLDWKEGRETVMVSTTALGAGINISGVKVVIHMGKTYGCSAFVQGSGRGGREGQTFQSITLMRTSALNALKQIDERLRTPEDAALIQFLTTDGCRRIPLSRYMDGMDCETDCASCNGVPCDNCLSGNQITEGQKRSQQQQKDGQVKRRRQQLYARREETVAEAERMDEYLSQHICSLYSQLRGSCSVCWAMDRVEESRTHTQHGCDMVNILGIGMDKIEFTKDSCCYSCGLPGDMCEGYQAGTCKSENFVSSLVLVGLSMGNREAVESLTYISERGFQMYGRGMRELLTWLGKPRRTSGLNGTNLFAVFCEILRRKKGLAVI